MGLLDEGEDERSDEDVDTEATAAEHSGDEAAVEVESEKTPQVDLETEPISEPEPEPEPEKTKPMDPVHLEGLTMDSFGDSGDFTIKQGMGIKTGKKTIMNIEASVEVANMCVLGNISFLLGRKINWDPVRKEILGDEQARRMMGRPQRHPYHL